MTNDEQIPEIGPEVPTNAVRVYGQSDALDDFPVLKAFQQYIDAEQTKARKRLAMLCTFFAVLMVVVISVFVMLLINVSNRNQALNDRMVELAMKERSAQNAPVVVQPSQDSAALLALTAKMDAMQKKLAEDQAKAEKAAAEAVAKAEARAAEAVANAEKAAKEAAERARQAAIEAAKPKEPTAEELEIKRLKALLASQAAKKAAAEEAERKRQEELEAYRRKHYPELYEKKPVKKQPVRRPVVRQIEEEDDDVEAIDYYDEEEDAEDVEEPPVRSPSRRPARSPAAAKPVTPAAKPTTAAVQPERGDYTIPVDVRGTRTSWRLPEE